MIGADRCSYFDSESFPNMTLLLGAMLSPKPSMGDSGSLDVKAAVSCGTGCDISHCPTRRVPFNWSIC